MWRGARACLVVFGILAVVVGVVYPAAVTLVARTIFSPQAEGSLIVRDGRVVGSELIGQPFDSPGDFWGRPSATGPVAYNAGSSTGSNLGPTNPALDEAVRGRAAALKSAHPSQSAAVPVELVTASASGLDPHISPAAAEYQVGRVATARGLSVEEVREQVARHTAGRWMGIVGEPRVNVLLLNLSLDQLERRSEHHGSLNDQP